MPVPITGYHVFIASPGGLNEERRAFRDVLTQYNEQEANPRGAHFFPVGWEVNPGGVGRPQRLINEQVRECDFFVLLLWDRWGTPPADPGTEEYRGYTSGTEEEYGVATECLQDAEQPMRDILCCFKAADPKQLSDPGPQLKRVLEFKKLVERDLMYKEFDELSGFKEMLRTKLGVWLRDHEGGVPKENQVDLPPAPAGEPAPEVTQPEPTNTAELIEQAERHAQEGELVEAEALFARASVRGDDYNALNAYGIFLIRVGRLAQAEAMFERVIELGSEGGQDAAVAMGYGNLGNVLQTRGELDEAEVMHRKSLEIEERLGRLEGMANQYGNLGNVLQTRGELDEAEVMHRKSLEIEERLGRLEGMANQYGNLGNVLQTRGDLDGAEVMYRKSLELNERLGRLEGMASDYGNLGNVLHVRGDLDGAEVMHRKSLELNERLGRLEGMASQYGNLGNVLQTRGDLDGAEVMHRKSLEIEERLGRLEGMASQYGNLGNVLQTRGDLDGARSYWEQALKLYEQIGMPHRVELAKNRLAELDADDEAPDASGTGGLDSSEGAAG